MNTNLVKRGSGRVLAATLLALLLMAGVAGCGSGDDDATDTSLVDTSTDDSTDTSLVDTLSTESTEATDTTDTTAETTTESTGTTGVSTTAADGAAAPVPDGSGCTPGDGDVLPDGRWFGFVSSREADSFSFDLACWFTGDEAVVAATEDGAESPPPNDYYIRNDNTTQRLLVPSPDPTVEFLQDVGDPASFKTIDYPTWVSEAPSRSVEPGAWVEITDGLVVTIEEQYQP